MSIAAPSLVALAAEGTEAIVAGADARTRRLVEGFVHQSGPPQAAFAWVALGSHARGELHCASDQDHALIWATERAAASSYAVDLAEHVIEGLIEFGLQPCDGGYMADRWSVGLDRWIADTRARVEAPTPQAVLETEVFLDVRPLSGDLPLSAARDAARTGADSPRLLHGLATAAVSFPTPLGPFGRLGHGQIDLKRGGLAPSVLLARLYALAAHCDAVGTLDRLAGSAGVLGPDLIDRLSDGFRLMRDLRLAHQLEQAAAGERLDDRIVVGDLAAEPSMRWPTPCGPSGTPRP